MRTDLHSETPDQVAPTRDAFDDVTTYEDGDSVVVCEKSDAAAWIRSDVTVDVSP